MFNLFKWLGGGANDANHTGGPETRSERAGGHSGDSGSGAPDTRPGEGTRSSVAAANDGTEQLRSFVAECIDGEVSELRAAITAELDSFRERLDRADRQQRDLTDEWHDALAKFAKIGNRLAAQARRDLEKASRDVDATPFGDEQPTFPDMRIPVLPPNHPEPSREVRKAELRRRLRGA